MDGLSGVFGIVEVEMFVMLSCSFVWFCKDLRGRGDRRGVGLGMIWKVSFLLTLLGEVLEGEIVVGY